jgi:ABC-2 type transport system permease protein
MTAYAEIAPPAPAPRAPVRRLAGVELRKMADTRAGFWLLIATALLAVGIVVVVLAVGNDSDRSLDELLAAALGLVSVLLPILGILVVTSEWSQRTALATFTLVPERERVIGAKLLAGVVFAAVATALCLVLAVTGTAIGGAAWSLTISDVAAGALYLVLGMLMGMALGLALMSSPLAIVLYFVLPTIVVVLVETIRAIRSVGEWVDTSRTLDALVQNEMAGGDWARLAVSMGVWLALPLLIGLVRLRRSELK